MEKSNFKAPVKETIDEVKKYIDLQLEYNKVVTRRKSGDTIGQVLLLAVVGFVFVFILLFLSLAFVNWYATHVGNYTTGFLIIALFYLFLALIVFAFKDALIFSPLRKYLAKNFSSKEEQDFFSGTVNASPQATKKYIEFLQKENRKQENVLQNHFKNLEQQLNWVNIAKNAASSIIQNLSTTTMMIKAAYEFGKKLTSGKKKKKMLKDKDE
ncbi:MAG: phage holin family protein [Bacteroidales bacterium]|nr:phage holin family protein [Bacteroidales bacterium]